MLVAVLLVTGFLVNQPPQQAPPAPAGTGVVTGEACGEDLRVLATMSPRAVGTNTVTVQLQDLTGEPVEPARPPTVRVRSVRGVDLGNLALTSSDAGTYGAEVVLPTAGTWRVQVSLRVDEFENPVTSLSFRVPPEWTVRSVRTTNRCSFLVCSTL